MSVEEGVHRVGLDGLAHAASQLEAALAFLEQLKGGTALRAPYAGMRPMVDALGRGVPFPSYTPPELRLFRGRLDPTTDKFMMAGEFSYRQAAPSNQWGRCHCRGETAFYGALNIETMLSEVGPEHGDRVHLGIAKLKPGARANISVIGEIDHIRRYSRPIVGDDATKQWLEAQLGQLDEHGKSRVLVVDAFFADAFRKPAHRGADYKLTAAISQFLLDGQNGLDGFIYPSVAHLGGLNAVIRPDRFDQLFEWESFSVLHITASLGFGLYGTRTIYEGQPNGANAPIGWTTVGL